MARAALIMNRIPRNCFDCKLQNWGTCIIVKKCHVEDGRPKWCPLVEIPEEKEGKDNAQIARRIKGSIKR